MHKPWRHQKTALNKINKALASADRAQAQLCCGSGKTRIFHMLLNNRRNDRFSIIFFPCIELIIQTLKEWEPLGSAGVDELLVVCSEDIDQHMTNYNGLNIGQITTEIANIRKFATTNRSRRKLILATYQSGSNICAAIWGRRIVDFIGYDEAHNTATGEIDNLFALTLHNDNLNTRKRLFLTATRRVGGKDQVNLVVMNNEKLFGKVIYKYSFRQALKDGIVKDFRIHVGLINTSGIDNIQSTHYDADIVLLRKTLESYQLKKGMTFHRTIKEAGFFCDRINETPDFTGLHINGTQNRKKKTETLKKFSSTQKSIITNSRYLIEGIDVPDTDLVAFMSKKESARDVSQSIGRLCRKANPNDTTPGVVLIPIFVNSTKLKESLNEEVEKGFEKLWHLIESLQDVDDFFCDWVGKARKLRNSGDSERLTKHLSQKINFESSVTAALNPQLFAAEYQPKTSLFSEAI